MPMTRLDTVKTLHYTKRIYNVRYMNYLILVHGIKIVLVKIKSKKGLRE